MSDAAYDEVPPILADLPVELIELETIGGVVETIEVPRERGPALGEATGSYVEPDDRLDHRDMQRWLAEHTTLDASRRAMLATELVKHFDCFPKGLLILTRGFGAASS